MKKPNFVFIWLRMLICAAGLLFVSGVARVQAQNPPPIRVEARYVFATDEDKYLANPKYHALDTNLVKKLSSPYRWKNYFELSRQAVTIPFGETKTNVVISKSRSLDIKNLGTNRVEVKLLKDGKLVSTHSETLSKDYIFVLAGDAGNQNAWMVLIRKIRADADKPKPAATMVTAATNK